MNYIWIFVVFSLSFGLASSSSYYFNLVVGDQSKIIYDNDNNLNNDSGPTMIGDYNYYVSLMPGSSNLFKLKISRTSSQYASGYILTGGVSYKIVLGSKEVIHTISLKTSSEGDGYSSNFYNNTTNYVRQTTTYTTPESCKSSNLTGITLNMLGNYQTYQINECYKERGFGNNNIYFDIISASDIYRPSPLLYPGQVLDGSGNVKRMYVINKTNYNLYIPYDSGINCDNYREGKIAVKDKNYFEVFCEGCGKFNGQDVNGSIVTGYSTQGGECNYQVFQCFTGSNAWDPASAVSVYPYLSCNKDCSDARIGVVNVPRPDGYIATGYVSNMTSNCSSADNVELFQCQNGKWTGINVAIMNATYTTCSTGVLLTGTCGDIILSGFLTEFTSDNELCDTYSSVIKPLWSSVNYGSNYSWTCVGTGGGGNANCSKMKSSSYVRYQCVFNTGESILEWQRINFPIAISMSGGASEKINYNIYDYIYANRNVGDPDYIAGYSCKADAICGSASGQATNQYPSSDSLCTRSSSIINNDTVGNGGDYNWTCKGLGGALGGADATCSAPKIPGVNGVCGSASGSSSVLRFSDLPLDSQLCSTADTISKPTWSSVSYNSNYTWTCNGTGGGSNMTCSLQKVYPYHQYQCQLSGKTTLNWVAINYPNNGSGSYSSKATTYLSGNYVYASPTLGDTYYIGDYSCKTNGVCGDANGTSSYTEPANMDCKVGKYTYFGDSGSSWDWSCEGINGGAPISCTVYKSKNATCGSADGKTYVEQPHESYLCGVYSSVDKYFNSSFSYIGAWSNFADNSTVRWKCIGVKGGTDIWCSATRKHYTRYQCKFQNSRLERVPDANTDLNPSIKTTYYLSNYIYASHINLGDYYVGGYVCKCPIGQTLDSEKGCITPVQPVNGACGTAKDTPTVNAPTANLCDQGNPSNITSNSSTYDWTCGGVNSGTDASCSVSKLVVNGSCGTTAYNCISGSSISNVYSNNKYTWTCDGSNGGSSPQCSLCDGGYVLSGNVCVYWDQYRLEACTGKPANSERHNTTITQRKYWYNPGQYWTDWSPSLEGTYSATADSNYCYYKCSNGYTWNGASCVVASYQGYQCTYQGPSNPPVWQLIPYSSSGSKSPIGTYKNAEYIFTDNTAGYTCDPKEAGQCGSATATTGYSFPSTNLCSGGAVVNTGVYAYSFVWQCNGLNGSTTNVACSAARKRDGACGTANGQTKTMPGATDPQIQNAFYASGLCNYSLNTRTASDVGLPTNDKATWTCNGLNGGTTAACTGIYDNSQVKCPTVDIASDYIGTSYSVISITGGQVWTSSVITAYTNNKTTSCVGVFSCPSEGGNASKINEICNSVCDAGYVYTGGNCVGICNPTKFNSTCNTTKQYSFPEGRKGDVVTQSYTDTIVGGTANPSSVKGTCSCADGICAWNWSDETCGSASCTDTCSYISKDSQGVRSCTEMTCDPDTQKLDRNSCSASESNVSWSCVPTLACRSTSDCTSNKSCNANGCTTVSNSSKTNICDGYVSNTSVCKAKNIYAGTCGGGNYIERSCIDYSCVTAGGNVVHDDYCGPVEAISFNDYTKKDLFALFSPKVYAEIEWQSQQYEWKCNSYSNDYLPCSGISNSSECVSNKCTWTSDVNVCSAYGTNSSACTNDTRCKFEAGGEKLGTCVEADKYTCNNGSWVRDETFSCSYVNTRSDYTDYMPGESFCFQSQPKDSQCKDCTFVCKGTSQTKKWAYPIDSNVPNFNWSYNTLYKAATSYPGSTPAECKRVSDACTWDSASTYRKPECNYATKVEYIDGKYQWVAYFCGYKGGFCLWNCAEWKRFYNNYVYPQPAYVAGSCDGKITQSTCQSTLGCRWEKQDYDACCKEEERWSQEGQYCKQFDKCGLEKNSVFCDTPLFFCNEVNGCTRSDFGDGQADF